MNANELHDIDEGWLDSVKDYLKKKKTPVRTKTTGQQLLSKLGKLDLGIDLPNLFSKKKYSRKRKPGVMDYLRKKHGEYDLASIERNGEPMNEKIMREGEEDKAELVMAAKDMVDRITGWMEDTAEMQSESMLELGDAIRDELGQEQSQAFIDQVKPALESLYQTLEGTRTTLTNGVAMLTGEGQPQDMLGADGMEEPGMEEPGMEPTVDAEMGDEFAASEPAAGGEEELGRAQRESIQRQIRRQKIAEHLELSRRLGQILSSKKK